MVRKVEKSIYLNNAATSFPKPQVVVDAIRDDMVNPVISEDRGTTNEKDVASLCRERMARLINVNNPKDIVLLMNASMALNMILLGVLKKGDHLIITDMEHNSILRPAKMLEERGVEVTIVGANEYGDVDIKDIDKSFKKNTKMVAVFHAANTTGTIMDIETLGNLCKQKGVLFTVDAAQSAGALHIDVEMQNIDFLAFTGHKALLGPQGTGGMYVRNKDIIDTIIEGGSGGWSDNVRHPNIMPVKFEVGTPNMPGIAGLAAGIGWVLEKGVENIHKKEIELINILEDGIKKIPSIKIIGPRSRGNRETSGVLSILSERFSPFDLGHILSVSYNIVARDGLLCAPLAHKKLGTYPEGVLRMSVGPLTTEEEVLYTVDVLKEVHGWKK